MSKKNHYLKTETDYYQAVEAGVKKFELRNNDRKFNIGDMIYLEETFHGAYTGRGLPPKEINYIFEGGIYGLEKGYIIFCWD